MNAMNGGAAETEAVLHAVNQNHGADWILIRPLPGGHQSGAYLVQDRQGGLAVLKWSSTESWAPQVLRAAPVVVRMRAAGWPTPAWRAVGTTSQGYAYQVQDLVAGTAMTTLGMTEVDMLLGLVESHSGLDPDPGRDWSLYVKEVLFQGRDGYRETVRASSEQGAAVVDAFMRLCQPHRDLTIPTGDLVHGDLQSHNVLVVHGQISGVVDVEGIGSGTRVIDLAGLLREGYLAGNGDPSAMVHLRTAAQKVAGAGVLRLCTAATVFSVLDFVLRRNPSRAARCMGPALQLAADLALSDGD